MQDVFYRRLVGRSCHCCVLLSGRERRSIIRICMRVVVADISIVWTNDDNWNDKARQYINEEEVFRKRLCQPSPTHKLNQIFRVHIIDQPANRSRIDTRLANHPVFEGRIVCCRLHLSCHLFILTGGRSVVVTKPQLEVGGNLIAINSVRLVVTTLLKIPYAIWIPIYFATLWGRSPNSSRVIYNVNFLLGTPSLFLLTPKPRNQARVTNKYSRIMSVIASLIKCSETSFQFVGVTYEEGPRTGFQGACEEIYQLFNTFCHHQLTLGHPFSTNCLRVSPHSSFRG